jgi:hypothetical protein
MYLERSIYSINAAQFHFSLDNLEIHLWFVWQYITEKLKALFYRGIYEWNWKKMLHLFFNYFCTFLYIEEKLFFNPILVFLNENNI